MDFRQQVLQAFYLAISSMQQDNAVTDMKAPTKQDKKPQRKYERKWPNCNVRHLVLSTNDFIVFIDENCDIDWVTTPQFDKLRNVPSNFRKENEILNKVATLESKPNSHLPIEKRIGFKRMLGEAIARAFKRDYVNAETVLTDAAVYIAQRNSEISRFWYLIASSLAGLMCALTGSLCYLLRIPLTQFIPVDKLFLFIAALGGGLGALLSIILRIGDSRLNADAGRNLHVLEGISRIVAGCISGLLIALFIKIGLLFPVLGNQKDAYLVMLAMAIVSGVSERWAPSLIAKVPADIKFEKEVKKVADDQKDNHSI